MLVVRFLRDSSFNPEIVQSLWTAFHDACRTLGLLHRTDPLTEIRAGKTIEPAETRERDPDAVRQRALDSLGVALNGTASSLVRTSALLCL